MGQVLFIKPAGQSDLIIRPEKDHMKRLVLITGVTLIILATAGFFLMNGFSSGPSQPEPPAKSSRPARVETITVAQTSISSHLSLSGTVEPYRVARLASPAEGPVQNIRVREGDRVKAGDNLLSIGRKQGTDALIVSRREDLRKEESNLRRVSRLVDRNSMAEEELDQARAAFERARSQLTQAEESAGDHAISAPWSGVVARVIVKEGEFVAPRTALLEIYDPASLVIQAAIPERHAAGIRTGPRVEVSLDAYPGETFQGGIERIYPYLESRWRTRTVEIALLDPVEPLLPGMFARLRVPLGKNGKTLVVPGEAVIDTPEGPVIYVAENGRAVKRPVETGLEEKNRVEIVSGLLPGDRVVVAGHQKLRPGAALSIAGPENPGNKSPGSTESPGQAGDGGS